MDLPPLTREPTVPDAELGLGIAEPAGHHVCQLVVFDHGAVFVFSFDRQPTGFIRFNIGERGDWGHLPPTGRRRKLGFVINKAY